ncbi:FAD:protein FMN transferase [Salipiger aestuarii]|uniref:FAD:protein FMN transferase n=1 Tax=Salipiger aestuarii TaxID=568098 RepID=UPI00123BCF65|nr:FAD:protein FMN transferase [Salipiger aestuarii]
MTAFITRRRLLIAAAASGLATALPADLARWEGSALGAHTQILMDHPDSARLIAVARSEIEGLERVFSLYRGESELSRLNRDGRLSAPSFELLDCLAQARLAHRATEWRFDPTVQPLWVVLAKAHAAGRTPAPDAVQTARARIGFDAVSFDAAEIRLGAGQALTLNGIAQGYIADRVARRLKAEGLRDVLVDTGEIAAHGAPAGHGGWPVSVANTNRRLILHDRALATSASLGTVLDAEGTQGHILHPVQTAPVAPRQVSVSAESAALADALSTALCLAENEATALRLLSGVAGARLEVFA